MIFIKKKNIDMNKIKQTNWNPNRTEAGIFKKNIFYLIEKYIEAKRKFHAKILANYKNENNGDWL